MDFHPYTTTREACVRGGLASDADTFYERALSDARAIQSGQSFAQLSNERDWERARRPYYNVWPSIVPMLTRMNLDLDSALLQLPMPALSIRLPTQQNPLALQWREQPFEIRCMLLAEIDEGRGLSILIDIGEVEDSGSFQMPVYTYRNFPRQTGLTVEQSLTGLGQSSAGESGVQIPDALVTDCVRLCCSLCLLEDDPSIIEPDVLSKDRDKFEATGDDKYIDKAHRRGKVGWNIGRRIELTPHDQRPQIVLAWTGADRTVPKIVPQRGQ
jgi:hypothetical protein